MSRAVPSRPALDKAKRLSSDLHKDVAGVDYTLSILGRGYDDQRLLGELDADLVKAIDKLTAIRDHFGGAA